MSYSRYDCKAPRPRQTYLSLILLLFLQETRDWNTEDDTAFRTPVTTKITKQVNFTPHLLRNIETHTRVELISLIFQPQFSLIFWQQGCPFSFGFGNQPLPTLLKVTPINKKEADLYSHSPCLLQTNSGLHFAPQHVLEGSVMGSWLISCHI